MTDESEITPPEGGYTNDTAVDAIENLFDFDDNENEEEADEQQESEQSEEEETEAEESEEVEETEESEEEQEAEEAPAIETLTDLAEALEVDQDELLATINVSTKVDGVSQDVSLKDLIRGYQTDQHNSRQSQAISNERKAIEAQVQENKKQEEAALHQYGQMLNALEQQVIGNINSEEMAILKRDNPQEWLMRQTELQDTRNQFNQLKQSAANRYAQLQQEMQDAHQKQISEMIVEAQRELPERIKGWNDETYHAILNYAVGQGIPREEVSQVVNWRHIDLLNKARLYDESKKQVSQAKKVVKKAPKKIKKAAPKPSVKPQTKNLAAAKKRFNKNGGKQKDAASLIEQML